MSSKASKGGRTGTRAQKKHKSDTSPEFALKILRTQSWFQLGRRCVMGLIIIAAIAGTVIAWGDYTDLRKAELAAEAASGESQESITRIIADTVVTVMGSGNGVLISLSTWAILASLVAYFAMRLRFETISHMGPRKRERQEKLDPGRLSSNLEKDGRTNQEDA